VNGSNEDRCAHLPKSLTQHIHVQLTLQLAMQCSVLFYVTTPKDRPMPLHLFRLSVLYGWSCARTRWHTKPILALPPNHYDTRPQPRRPQPCPRFPQPAAVPPPPSTQHVNRRTRELACSNV
jgi:hypothetical protein